MVKTSCAQELSRVPIPEIRLCPFAAPRPSLVGRPGDAPHLHLEGEDDSSLQCIRVSPLDVYFCAKSREWLEEEEEEELEPFGEGVGGG